MGGSKRRAHNPTMNMSWIRIRAFVPKMVPTRIAFLYQNRPSTDGFWVLSFWTEPKWLCAAIPTQALQMLVTFLYLTVRVGDEIKFDPDPKCNPEDVSHGYSWEFKKKHNFSPDRWCSSALFRFLSGPGPPKHLVDISVKLETIQFYPIFGGAKKTRWTNS